MISPSNGATLYVDTGHLHAQLIQYLFPESDEDVAISSAAVVPMLAERCAAIGLPVRRQQWYDGAYSTLSKEQAQLSLTPTVILRTGQLIQDHNGHRKQKGVDTLLVRDIVVAVHTGDRRDIVLFSGDADMLPAVEEAARMGVRVHLIGFSTGGEDGCAQRLRMAADTYSTFDPEDFRDATTIRPSARTELPAAIPVQQGCSPTPTNMPPHAHADGEPGPYVWSWRDVVDLPAIDESEARTMGDLGRAYGRHWYRYTTPVSRRNASELTSGSIPPPIDSRLLKTAGERFGLYGAIPENDRVDLRAGFVAAITNMIEQDQLQADSHSL